MNIHTLRSIGLTAVTAVSFSLLPVSQTLANAGYAVRQPSTPNWEQRQLTSSVKEEYAKTHILVGYQDGRSERVALTAGQTVEQAVSYWQQQANVKYAEPDHRIKALGQSTSWGYDDIQAAAAATTNSATGTGIVVAVIDTGVDYNHEDLDANNWVNSGETADNDVDDDSNGLVDDYFGYDFIGTSAYVITPDNDPMDEYGHGTHVAGIIAAENNTTGVRGVAPAASIMPVKVLDASGYGWDSTIADGIMYAADEGADIINMSLGSSLPSSTIRDAIDYAEAAGVLVIAAAGNSYSYTAPSYPAAYSNVISVGSTNEDGYKSDFSNWGKVDVVAPGQDIVSSIPGNLYESYSGTSMASPMVAGVAALAMQKFSLTNNPKAVRQIVEGTTTDFGSIAGPDYVAGRGMVNALNATSARSTSAIMYADSGTIVSDGADSISVTISVRNASSAPVSGADVAWSTTGGTLSSSLTATDGNGQSTVTLTADDVSGLITVTADSSVTDATTIQFAVLNDIPQPMSIGVSKVLPTDGTVLPNINFQPGDTVTIWAHPTEGDIKNHNVTMSYSITNANNEAVTGLSGTTETLDVGEPFYGIYYFPQVTATSPRVTLPTDLASGEYHLSVTVNDVDSGESSTATNNFWVGEQPQVLVVDNDASCGDTPVEGMSYGFVTYCTNGAMHVAETLQDLGYTTAIWNTTQDGFPAATDLQTYAAVVWLDNYLSYTDNSVLQGYLDAGGNLLLSAEAFPYANLGTGGTNDFMWNYLHARAYGELLQPTHVTGVANELFSGKTFATDTYNIAGNGTHAFYSGYELGVNTDGGTAVLSYPIGDGERVAGVASETSTYRVLFTTMGVEEINDSGTNSKSAFLESTMNWFLGDPTVTSVTPSSSKNNLSQTITVTGTNFVKTGTTTVQVRNRQLADVTVVDHTTITATLPAGLDAKSYSVTVTRADGASATLNNALTIKQGGLSASGLSLTKVSNNATRKITVTGYKFNANTKVLLGKTEMTKVEFTDPTSLTFSLPAGFKPDNYKVKVQNAKGEPVVAGTLVVRVGFTKVLEEGSTDSQVKALEKRLKIAGYFSEKPNKTFDGTTEEALVRFQTDNFLQVTGKTDAATRYYLNNQ